jgi:hypothetical protein
LRLPTAATHHSINDEAPGYGSFAGVLFRSDQRSRLCLKFAVHQILRLEHFTVTVVNAGCWPTMTFEKHAAVIVAVL